MAEQENNPLRWSIAKLTDAYRNGELSPVEVTEAALARIEQTNGILHAYVRTTEDVARQQAQAAAQAYRDGSAGPLAGIPISIKDAFHIQGEITTLGSLFHEHDVMAHDSGSVRRLRQAGVVFTGKTNVPEFCQSATTDNLLGPDTANPWDMTRTPGGSSGGSAASVVAGTCLATLGSDGGGSIRIPAAFCGLAGLKPTVGRCADEGGFRGFEAFGCIGPLAWRVADVRTVYNVLAEDNVIRRPVSDGLRIAWCPCPENRPVEPTLLEIVSHSVNHLAGLGHHIDETSLPLSGWKDAFGPLLLDEEHKRRGHLLAHSERLTDYQRITLEAAAKLEPEAVTHAAHAHARHRETVNARFDRYDLLATPATATPAFSLRERPREINGQHVSSLWGAFPFSVPFNVSGHPAIVVPVGLVDGLPVAIQLVAAMGHEDFLLDIAEDLEEALGLHLWEYELPMRQL